MWNSGGMVQIRWSEPHWTTFGCTESVLLRTANTDAGWWWHQKKRGPPVANSFMLVLFNVTEVCSATGQAESCPHGAVCVYVLSTPKRPAGSQPTAPLGTGFSWAGLAGFPPLSWAFPVQPACSLDSGHWSIRVSPAGEDRALKPGHFQEPVLGFIRVFSAEWHVAISEGSSPAAGGKKDP